jgi:3-oxosteroid 1-dehydrogenase
MNEAEPYSAMGHVLYEKNAEREGSTIPCYFIMDGRFRRRYIFGLNPPGVTAPSDLSSGYMVKARTIGELARKAGLPAEALEKTVEEYNCMAEAGKDTAFGKGDHVYDRYYGDPTVEPNPCMYPLKKPPFYCVKFYPGDLGTKGGLVTNEKAQVLRRDGSVIEGLYATGNNAASVMGRSYPGPGATVGASMVFGFVAANEIARYDAREVSGSTFADARAAS